MSAALLKHAKPLDTLSRGADEQGPALLRCWPLVFPTFCFYYRIASWEASVDGRNSTNYRRLIESLNENKQSYINKLNDYLESEISEIRKDSKRELDDGLIEIEDCVKSIFADIIVIDEFENYVKANLSGFLYQRVISLDENIAKHMSTKFENIVANAVLRIKQYTGTENNAVKIENFEATIIETDVKSFAKEEDEITKLQRELSEKKALDKKAGIDIQKKRAEISRIDLDIESQRMLLVQKNNNKRTEISRLGAMPEKETKYRRETYYEYRGGLGILDAIWGPKERTRSVPYSDDTNQQRWKKMKSDIETKYREKENQINAQSRMLESKRRQCDDEIKHLEKTEAARKQDIRSTQSLLETKIDYLNNQRERKRDEIKNDIKSLQDRKDTVEAQMLPPIERYTEEVHTKEHRDGILGTIGWLLFGGKNVTNHEMRTNSSAYDEAKKKQDATSASLEGKISQKTAELNSIGEVDSSFAEMQQIRKLAEVDAI